MPSCLHVSTGNSFSFVMNTILSFFFTNLLSPHKTLHLLLLNLTRGNNHGFCIFGQKLLQSIVLSPCSGCSFLLLFFLFFFFFFKKNFTEALIAKKKFSPETIQNIDASSTFDRMLWLKLQQW